jgi:2-C-methyl-D-erythritol 4-phosphate cytidylyltransferase
MAARVPKQYLVLAGRTVLEHTLDCLAAEARIARIVVAISADDEHFDALRARLPSKVECVTGGAERCHSVLAGLHSLAQTAPAQAWVLVHDAARPCLRAADLARLLDELAVDTVGGILGNPVRDTLKRCAADGAVAATIDRAALWHALTPQMFRLGALIAAIEAALADGIIVTDEAQAIERLGCAPRVIAGHGDNLKITHPDDLALAELILAAQARSTGGTACG